MQRTAMARSGLLSSLAGTNASRDAPTEATAWRSPGSHGSGTCADAPTTRLRATRPCSRHGSTTLETTPCPIPLRPSLTDLESFTTRPTRYDRLSPVTRRVECSALKGWLGWLHKRRLIESDPTMELQAPRGQGRKRRPVPDEHWLPLVAAGVSMSGMRPRTALKTYLGPRPGVFYCGLRLSEIGSPPTHAMCQADTLVGVIRKGGKECDVPWLEMVRCHHQHPALRYLLPDPDTFRRELTAHVEGVRRRAHVLAAPKDAARAHAEALPAGQACHRTTRTNLRHSCA